MASQEKPLQVMQNRGAANTANGTFLPIFPGNAYYTIPLQHINSGGIIAETSRYGIPYCFVIEPSDERMFPKAVGLFPEIRIDGLKGIKIQEMHVA